MSDIWKVWNRILLYVYFCLVELLVPHWGGWGEASACSKTCDDGIAVQLRQCNNPKPRAGMKCDGDDRRTTICNERQCNPGGSMYTICIQSDICVSQICSTATLFE